MARWYLLRCYEDGHVVLVSAAALITDKKRINEEDDVGFEYEGMVYTGIVLRVSVDYNSIEDEYYERTGQKRPKNSKTTKKGRGNDGKNKRGKLKDECDEKSENIKNAISKKNQYIQDLIHNSMDFQDSSQVEQSSSESNAMSRINYLKRTGVDSSPFVEHSSSSKRRKVDESCHSQSFANMDGNNVRYNLREKPLPTKHEVEEEEDEYEDDYRNQDDDEDGDDSYHDGEEHSQMPPNHSDGEGENEDFPPMIHDPLLNAQLYGEDYPHAEMVPIGFDIFCRASRHHDAVYEVTNERQCCRQLMRGVFKPDTIERFTLAGRSHNNNNDDENPNGTEKLKCLHGRAVHAIITYAREKRREMGWTKMSRSEVRAGMTQNITDLRNAMAKARRKNKTYNY